MFPILFIALCLVIFLFVMVPMMTRHGPWGHDREDFPQRRALDVLNERFAKGEIDKTKYEEKRRLISS
jgi:putative membrane protein